MPPFNPPDPVKAKVNIAIARFLEQDSYLLEVDANERTISNRLAVHLSREFPRWDTDCEYNRNLDQIKRLKIKQRKGRGQVSMQNVVPDIIVHRRSSNRNLLAIEIKKTSSPESDNHDLGKLRALKRELGYRYALFLKFECGSECGLTKCKWAR